MLCISNIDTFRFFMRLFFDVKTHCVMLFVFVRMLIRYFKDNLRHKSSGSVSHNAASHHLESLLVAKEPYNGRP